MPVRRSLGAGRSVKRRPYFCDQETGEIRSDNASIFPRVERFGFHFQTFPLPLVLFCFLAKQRCRPRVTGTCAYDGQCH
jgi:hypothetical protein